MKANQVWVTWFMATIVTGGAAEVGMQSALGLPLGYGIAFMIFVAIVACTIADFQEFLYESREDSEKSPNIAEGDALLQDIDKELNGPRSS